MLQTTILCESTYCCEYDGFSHHPSPLSLRHPPPLSALNFYDTLIFLLTFFLIYSTLCSVRYPLTNCCMVNKSQRIGLQNALSSVYLRNHELPFRTDIFLDRTFSPKRHVDRAQGLPLRR